MKCIGKRKKHQLNAEATACVLCGGSAIKPKAPRPYLTLKRALERIRDMAVRPECVCGRPTGTAAIRICAETALKAQQAEKSEN